MQSGTAVSVPAPHDVQDAPRKGQHPLYEQGLPAGSAHHECVWRVKGQGVEFDDACVEAGGKATILVADGQAMVRANVGAGWHGCVG